jgi:hypothetical protein
MRTVTSSGVAALFSMRRKYENGSWVRNCAGRPPRVALRIVVVSSSIVWRETPPADAATEAKSPDQLAPPKSCLPSACGSTPSGRSTDRQMMMSGLVHGLAAPSPGRASRSTTVGASPKS